MNFRVSKREVRKSSLALLFTVVATSSFSTVFAFDRANGSNIELREQVKITGRVIDHQGVAIQGATVSVKDDEGDSPTQTDQDGNFMLLVANSAAPLIVSYVGYQSQEVSIAVERTNITVRLLPVDALDEVVVVGYGRVKKRDLTGAVASVKSEEIMRTPTSNVMDALQGKVSGMDIMKSSGRAGSSVDGT